MSKPGFSILIAEDDNRTRQALVTSVSAAGYHVIAAADGQAALDSFKAAAGTVDLVILDVLMPHMNGLQVCQAIRQISDVPIIIATVLGSSADRITGLEMGANDYIVKPFSTKELIARIRSILRRVPSPNAGTAAHSENEHPSPHQTSNHQTSNHQTSNSQILKIGQLTIDPITRKAYRGSHQLRLTEIEFRLIELLANRPGYIFSRGEILNELWGYDVSSAADTKTVDVHISRLRIKLNDHTRDPKFIITIRGRGYMFLVQKEELQK